MNKRENRTYAKPEDKKAMILATIKNMLMTMAKVFISAQNYLQFVNDKKLLVIQLQRKLLFNLSFQTENFSNLLRYFVLFFYVISSWHF